MADDDLDGIDDDDEGGPVCMYCGEHGCYEECQEQEE